MCLWILGRAHAAACQLTFSVGEVEHTTTQHTRQTALLDETVLGLILDNAVANAFKHRHPQSPFVRFNARRLGGREGLSYADQIRHGRVCRPPVFTTAQHGLDEGLGHLGLGRSCVVFNAKGNSHSSSINQR